MTSAMQRAADLATWTGGQIKGLRSYVDSQVNGAKAYTDAQGSAGDATTLAAAKAYADTKAAAVKADIEGNATGAFDTLGEVQAYIESDQTATAAILVALGKRVRVDAAQTFTNGEQAQGRANLSVPSVSDLGPDTDLVALAVAARDS